MPLRVCADCTTRYAGDLARCPNCSSTTRREEGGGSRLPFLDIACGTDTCRAFAVVRRVYLRQPLPGVIEMPLLVCACCGMAMGALDGSMTEETMPKITRHGGATNAAAEREHLGTGVPTEGIEMPPDGTLSPEISGDGSGEALPLANGEQEEGEDLSAGSSSETSSEKEPSSPETSETPLPKRAPGTGSRSKKGRAASSTAGTTDGPGPETASDSEG